MGQGKRRITQGKIWRRNVRDLEDEELYEIMDFLNRERCKLFESLLSREGVLDEEFSVLPHTQTRRDAA